MTLTPDGAADELILLRLLQAFQASGSLKVITDSRTTEFEIGGGGDEVGE